jgi:ubiquinone/menaquinone biosynthesis C-methylase UbiE
MGRFHRLHGELTVPTPLDAGARSTSTYNAAADHYDDTANVFWARFGRATVERLALRPGSRVLDVCCGSGASALPAAEAVGPQGFVMGVDLADNLLALARAKAQALALRNVEFRHGDLLALPVSEASFDAVVCVFGIFFVPDMPLAVRALWRAVRPGGVLAVTTWGPRWMEPATTAFWNSVRDVRPDLYRGFNPWDRICHPEPVVALLREGGAEDSHAVAEAAMHPIPSPDAWWSVVMGSGYRGTFDQLDPEQQAHVREANLRFVRDSKIAAVEANVVYATARKPWRYTL